MTVHNITTYVCHQSPISILVNCSHAFYPLLRHLQNPTAPIDAWKQALKDNKVVMLDCFATWCGPCKAIAPILANHSNDEKYKDVFFAKIDVDDLPELSQELGIRAMPTFMMFKDGEKADELVGANPNALVTLLDKGL
ncbi:hypothetical protein LQW54_011720 [Pestalotiopsis sp. IQ-011]